MGIALPIILGIINGGFKLLANHLGKPEGWKPSAEEWDNLEKDVAEATPEKMKQEARDRLAGTIDVPPSPV